MCPIIMYWYKIRYANIIYILDYYNWNALTYRKKYILFIRNRISIRNNSESVWQWKCKSLTSSLWSKACNHIILIFSYKGIHFTFQLKVSLQIENAEKFSYIDGQLFCNLKGNLSNKNHVIVGVKKWETRWVNAM